MAENTENQHDDEAAVEVASQKRSRKVADDGSVSEDAPAEVVEQEINDVGALLDEERKAEQRKRNEVPQQRYEGDLEELKAAGVPAQLVDGRDPDAQLIA